MSGPPPKQPSRRIRTTTKNIGMVKSVAKAPAMPRGLCQAAQTAWTTYWGDAVSGVLRPPDATVAIRWAKNLDRYYRLLSEADAEPIVIGSTGQPRSNPAYDIAYKIEASIRADEAQLGIGALARLRLGAQLAESAKTLADLNAEAEAGNDDPRITLLRAVDNSEPAQ